MDLKKTIRSIPDYPKKGILFRDITTLIKNEKAFAEAIDQLVDRSKSTSLIRLPRLNQEVSFLHLQCLTY